MGWPQACWKKCTCFDSGSVAVEVADRLACQKEGEKVGHRYIQYLPSKKLCATSETCDNANRKEKDSWEIFWRPWSYGGSVSPQPAPPPAEKDEDEDEKEREGDGEADGDWIV